MTDYGRLNDIQGIDALLKRLVSVSSEKAASLREQYPGLPEDYVEFLLRIGAGEVGSQNYMIYTGLIPAEEIYGERKLVGRVLLFGDDLCGFAAGFDTQTWRVVEVDTEDPTAVDVAPDFATFIAQKFSEIASWQ
jgi:hypothetical protein